MANTLYELTDQYNAFCEAVENGEITDGEVIDDTLESIQEAFDEKCEHIALLCKNLTAEAEVIKAEAKKLTDRAATKTNLCERLKDYLSRNLMMIGQEKLETPKCKLSFRRSDSVQIYDEERLLKACADSGIDGLAETVSTVKFNKNEIKKAIKDGAELDGAVIVTTKNIQIK